MDVVIALKDAESKRDLGDVLRDIAHRKHESGTEIIFHQYEPEQYRVSREAIH